MGNIRPHRLSDAAAIGAILADGWRRAYAGFMPAERLRTHGDRTHRAAEMAEFLADEFDPDSEAIFVAEDAGRLVGFIHLALEDKADLGAEGAINLLYVDGGVQGRGVGRDLILAGAEWFGARVSGPIAVSAFAENPFAGFYAHIGGVEALRRHHDIAGKTIESVVYLWPNAEALARGAARETDAG